MSPNTGPELDHDYFINFEENNNEYEPYIERLAFITPDVKYEIFLYDNRIYFHISYNNFSFFKEIPLTNNEDLAFKIREAILDKNENLLKKVLMLL